MASKKKAPQVAPAPADPAPPSNQLAVAVAGTLPATSPPALQSTASFGDVPLACIRVSKTNPRKIFAEDDLQDLAASIEKQGVAQPILIRPIEQVDGVTYFELVAGERRFRASRIAGKDTIPAIVRELSDREAFELQVLENLQRVDLHPLEEAEGFEALMKQYNVTADELADKIGKSRAYVYASLKLCALEPKPREAFYAGKLTKSTALLVARIPVKKLQEQCVSEITRSMYNQDVMSFREAAGYVERNYMLHLKKAAFKPSDDKLMPEAGSCTACPKRTGNQPEIFQGVNADVCTDPICYKAKGEAHVIHLKKLAAENGQTVLSGAEAKKIMPYGIHSDMKGGYVALDRTNYDDPQHRTYRQILGKKVPTPTLLESPQDGALVQIVKLDEIAPLLEQKGIKPAKDTLAESREREKAQEAKSKLEREYRKRLFTETHSAAKQLDLDDADLRLVALQMFDSLPSGTIPTKLVMQMYGWTDETFAWPDRKKKEIAAIAALTPAELNQFIRDCALSRELDVNVYTATAKDVPENMLALAKRAGVDAKSIRAVVDGEAKAKVAAKKKAADKKALKDTTATSKAADASTKPSAASKANPSGKANKPQKSAVEPPQQAGVIDTVTLPLPEVGAPQVKAEPASVLAPKTTAEEEATRIAKRQADPAAIAWPFPTTIRAKPESATVATAGSAAEAP